MKCFLMRWLISDALDSGNEFSPTVRRHLTSCAECRDFAALSDEVAMSLSRDAEKVADPASIFGVAGQRSWGWPVMKPVMAMAVAACVIVAVSLLTPNRGGGRSIEQVTATVEEIAVDYNPSALVTTHTDRFHGEIRAIGKDVEGMAGLLLASTPFVSTDEIADLLL